MRQRPKMKSPVATWKRVLLSLGCVLALSVSLAPQPANATDLPPGVLNYLRQKDPRVKVRFDAVVVFSNGETYVPVLPQDPTLNPDSQQVVATYPDKAAYPDLIQFDNNFFLIRLIQTASGRLTFPKMDEYPIQLKEGMLPQDFVLPDNLFIPVELKVILGALPYNPSNSAVKTPDTSSSHNSPLPESGYQLKSTVRLTYVFDLTEQRLIGIDTITGRKQGDVPLDCVPSSLRLSGDGKLLFAPCLSTNELVVVDTGSNLVKTRVPVGQRPDAALYLEDSKTVVVSNRFSPFLSLLNSEELVGGQKIDLPGNGGAMAIVPGGKSPQIVVADAFKSQIYVVDMTTRAVTKTVKGLEDVSAIRAFRDEKGRVLLWAASRTKGQLAVIDADHDVILKTLNVGAKPVDMAEYENKLYVVSAGANQVDVVDRPSVSVVTTIPLDTESFPAGIVTMNDEKRAFVVTAASNSLVVINLAANQVENTFPVEFRANMIATVPDKYTFTPDPEMTATPDAPASTKTDGKGKSDEKPAKHHGFFGKPVLQTKTSSSSTKRTPVKAQAAVMPKVSTSSAGNAQKDIPVQRGVASSSPLSGGDVPGKIRLFQGKSSKQSVMPDANATQTVKAGARVPNANAPEPAADNALPPSANTPNSMLMMAPDVQK